jgi:hypothetical protein
MADIYRLAYVTIVASCSSSVKHGCLHNRGYFFCEGVDPPQIELRCLNQNGEKTSVLAFEEPWDTSHNVDHGNPINERG